MLLVKIYNKLPKGASWTWWMVIPHNHCESTGNMSGRIFPFRIN